MRIAPDFADSSARREFCWYPASTRCRASRCCLERLRQVMQLLERLPKGATVFLEDGGYYDPSFRKLIYGALGSRIDVYSMNEDELQSQVGRSDQARRCGQVLQRRCANCIRSFPLTPSSCTRSIGRWPMAMASAAMPLRCGRASPWRRRAFAYGDDFTRADYDEIGDSRAPNAAGAEFAREPFNAASGVRGLRARGGCGADQRHYNWPGRCLSSAVFCQR